MSGPGLATTGWSDATQNMYFFFSYSCTLTSTLLSANTYNCLPRIHSVQTNLLGNRPKKNCRRSPFVPLSLVNDYCKVPRGKKRIFSLTFVLCCCPLFLHFFSFFPKHIEMTLPHLYMHPIDY